MNKNRSASEKVGIILVSTYKLIIYICQLSGKFSMSTFKEEANNINRGSITRKIRTVRLATLVVWKCSSLIFQYAQVERFVANSGAENEQVTRLQLFSHNQSLTLKNLCCRTSLSWAYLCLLTFVQSIHKTCRSAAARKLRLRVRIQPEEWMFVCCVCFVLSGKSLQRADHSSREVLPTVVRRWVWSRNLKNREAVSGVGPQHHRGEKGGRGRKVKRPTTPGRALITHRSLIGSFAASFHD